MSAPVPSHIIAYPRRSIPSVSGRNDLTLLLLLLSGDITVNPGPMQHDVNTTPIRRQKAYRVCQPSELHQVGHNYCDRDKAGDEYQERRVHATWLQ